ncbi:hypothetical protein BJY00DRAFT_311999 [Aspergillus carlsbadensis]|nr:hypothetical protein BJY00DRAFT_311999 [Aspergillus carlsbadensis]
MTETNASRRGIHSAEPSFLIERRASAAPATLHTSLQPSSHICHVHATNRLQLYCQAKGPIRSQSSSACFHGNESHNNNSDISDHPQGNIACFFVSYLTILVLATYRPLSDAKFPSGIDDAIAAIRFTKTTIR